MPADHGANHWATFFATFAGDLAADRDPERTAYTIVSRVSEVVPEARHAALTVRRRRGFDTLAATSDLAHDVDRLQVTSLDGPLTGDLDAVDHVRSGDLAHEDRWSRWSAVALERGVRSVLSLRLSGDDGMVGALSLYAEEAGCFDGAAPLGLVYATHAGQAVVNNRLVSGLRTALESRHTIGLAQGILMREYGIDVDSAFALLTRYSSRLNVKLRAVAEVVVATGRLPEDPESYAEAPTA